jgi:hypothetical protein
VCPPCSHSTPLRTRTSAHALVRALPCSAVLASLECGRRARARSLISMSNLSVRHSRTVIVCRRDAERHLSLSTCPKEIERDYENL